MGRRLRDDGRALSGQVGPEAGVKQIVISILLCLAAPLAAAQEMDHSKHMAAMNGMPVEGGQSAFAAIQEIVGILENDPHTDWSKVDIEALRQHLIDMDNVTLRAAVTASENAAFSARKP